jgi:uncharacterized membrane protein
MKRVLLLVALLFVFLFPAKVSADEGWIIDNFQSDIAIQETGEVRIVETLEVNFNSLDKHGIYRDIPYVYESNGEKTYTQIKVESVLQNDKKAQYETSTNEGFVRIKIGDPDKTISGKNLYVITYQAKGVLRSFADHDELYWNVTGNGWGVPVTYSEAVVRLPKEGITKITCFEGYAGSTTNCQYTQESPQLARFQTIKQLEENEGLTVVVGYTKGLFPILTVERPKTFWEKFIEWPSLSTLAFGLLAGITTIVLLWSKYGRDYWFGQNIFGKPDDLGTKKPIGAHETITVEFTPPEKLRPAEMGVLMDERADTHDVVATIIDLATRGFLTITEIPKKWVFGSVDYEIEKREKDTAGLIAYEKILYNNLFTDRKSVKVSSLKKTFYDDLEKVKKQLYEDVIAKKLFSSNPESTRNIYLGIGIATLVAGFVLVSASVGNDFIFGADISVGLVVSGILLLIMSKFMPKRTAYGRELYRRARGYYLFINTAEKHRQKFFEQKNMFNEVLPYAIALGLTDKFAKQMKDIGLQPQTTWYTGVHPITTSNFGSSMNAFASSMSTAITSTPSSSGGFSSGGSSGGGFGGGGGGSW